MQNGGRRDGAGNSRSGGNVGGGERLLIRTSTDSGGRVVRGAVVRNIPAKSDGTRDNLRGQVRNGVLAHHRYTHDKQSHSDNPNPAGHASGTALSLPEPAAVQAYQRDPVVL